jgi:hypothetical protein
VPVVLVLNAATEDGDSNDGDATPAVLGTTPTGFTAFAVVSAAAPNVPSLRCAGCVSTFTGPATVAVAIAVAIAVAVAVAVAIVVAVVANGADVIGTKSPAGSESRPARLRFSKTKSNNAKT